MNEPSGRKWREPFAHFDPDTSSWRTSQPLLPLENSPEPSVTWPRSGTWDLGAAYGLPTSAHPMGGSERSSLLPTPAVNDMGDRPWAEQPGAWEAWTEKHRSSQGNGNGHGKSLAVEARSLLPTPSAADALDGHASRSGSRSGELLLPGLVKTLLPTPTSRDHWSAVADSTGDGWDERRAEPARLIWRSDATECGAIPTNTDIAWGKYEPAIRRWESILGRPAPAPTEPGPKSGQRLSPRFVEFMMGLPEGWVTGVPGLSRNAQLKALGNGVVPQQAAAALRMLTDMEAAA